MKTEKTKLSYEPILSGLTNSYSILPKVERQIAKKLAGAYVNENSFTEFEQKFVSQLREVECYDCHSDYTKSQIQRIIAIVEERGIRKPETVKKLYSVKNNIETVILGK
ncbi:MAG: hypothetical protein PHU51_01715 [Candidatus Nanoarchaeia archaeon]|jgi:hypothetical protein|nr:hypothetical protein [Candidatus Nanoarchaeia archaeon]